MRRFAIIVTVVGLSVAPAALSQDDSEAGRLERLIEDALSGDDRDVTIRGFQGLLSGQATFDTLTISDADGIWLTVENAELDWNRLALLRGRLSVSALTADSIDFARPPLPAEPELPDAAASPGFALPDLPVAIQIGEISVTDLSLGEPLFGEAAELSLTGSAALENGEGNASITLDRIDADGHFELSGEYSNNTDILTLNFLAQEAEDGIIVKLANIPGAPSLDLSLSGSGPLSDYSADIKLATDGQDRLAGTVTTSTISDAADTDREFTASLGGDVTPLFAPQFQSFFGDSVQLDLNASRKNDGVLDIANFDLETRAMSFNGALALAPEGLPLSVDITGNIADPSGDPVLLPTSGDPIRVQNADIAVTFDETQEEFWSAKIEIGELQGTGYSAETLTLDGSGRLNPVNPNRLINGTLDFAAKALDLGGDAVDQALGEDVTGTVVFDWRSGSPLTIPRIEIAGQDYGLNATGTVSGFGSGLEVTGKATANARDLSAFSGIAGRDLAGALSVNADVSVEALTGQLKLTVDAKGENLSVSQEQADRILAGEAAFTTQVSRDTEGLHIEAFDITTPNATANGKAEIIAGATQAEFDISLADAGLILDGVSGGAQIIGTASQADTAWDFDVTATAPNTNIVAKGQADTSGDVPSGDVTLSARIGDLSQFSDLAGRALTGSVNVDGTASGVTDFSSAKVDLTGTLANVSVGIEAADAILDGQAQFTLDGEKSGSVWQLNTLSFDGDHLTLSGQGSYGDAENGTLSLEARMAQAGLVLDGVSGPLSVVLNADEGSNDVWNYELDTTAPDTEFDAKGTITPFAQPIEFTSDLNVSAGDLTQFSTLASRTLGGSVSISGQASGKSDLSMLDLDLTGSAQDVITGITDVDRLLRGRTQLELDGSIENESIEISQAFISSPSLDLRASGSTQNGRGDIDLSARLADLGIFIPDFAGPVTLDGTASPDGGDSVGLDFALTGPGGISADLSGSAAQDFSSLNIDLSGGAPLGIANRFISPMSLGGNLSFDLAVNGPPALNSVSGRISTASAQFVLPAQNIVVQNIGFETQLNGTQAAIQMSGDMAAGGRLSVSGPVALTPPFNGNLDIVLDQVGLTDGALYQTSLDGSLNMNGALGGGARIGGAITVGETEINLAATSAGAGGAIPEIEHIGESAASFRTREYAGLVVEERTSGGGTAVAYPLDIDISVPRLFVRGRGLDAELAGQIAVGGTTANVVPVGEIDLVRGRLDLLNARLRLEEGSIVLQGAFVPVIDFRAVSERRTEDDDVEAFVNIEGPVNDPKITFTSEPSLPEDEVLARILFGTDLANISALQAVQLANAAATLAGGGIGTGGLRSGLGLDDLDVTTDEEGNTAVTAGAYITDRLYADVTTKSDGETELNLNFDVTDTITATGSSASDGNSTLGIYFQKDY